MIKSFESNRIDDRIYPEYGYHHRLSIPNVQFLESIYPTGNVLMWIDERYLVFKFHISIYLFANFRNSIGFSQINFRVLFQNLHVNNLFFWKHNINLPI